MNRKILIWGILLCSTLIACTKQEVINTGISSPYFDGNMMDYLRSDKYNWELTVQMIEQANLTDLFEGKVDTLPEITFFAPPSYSILRFLYESLESENPDNVYQSVKNIPPKLCREYILKHVVKGKYLKEDIDYRNMSYPINDENQDGGTWLESLEHNQFIAYLERVNYEGVPNSGPIYLKLHSPIFGTVPMASPNIQPKNGIVHALNYSYNFGNI
jgi:hypothetical protein